MNSLKNSGFVFWKPSIVSELPNNTLLPIRGFVFLYFLLSTLGLVILSSASQAFSTGNSLFLKQLFWFFLSFIALVVTSYIPLDWIRRYTSIAYLLGIVLLFLVLIPEIGSKINGSRRWIGLGGFNMQPSEGMKFFIVLFLSHYLSIHQRRLKRFKDGYLMPFLWLGIPCGLIILEPDFGTALLFGIVGVTLFFLAGMKLRYLLPTVLLGLIIFSTAIFHNPERLSRVTSFWNPEKYKEDQSYQLWQGMLAFGVGGVNGVGLGNGRQQTGFLPEAQTDFVFSVLGEELGFIATIGVVLVFFGFGFLGIRSLHHCHQLYHFLLVSGACLFILYQALINIGVVTGCLPTKGISLPFISYGGSSLIVMGVLVGLIINVLKTEQRKRIR